MVDNRLTAATLPPSSFLRNEGLDWFVKGENEDYLVPAFFRLSPAEVQALNEAAQHAAQLLKEAALKVARENRWRELGIPDRAIPLLKYSLAHELDDYLIGRFDFAGGIDGLPLKLIEFNADTNTHGEKRAFVVSGQYEELLPMDIYPQHLMKAIITGNIEKMEGLGITELTEEDVALCEFACTSKNPLQSILRQGLENLKEQI